MLSPGARRFTSEATRSPEAKPLLGYAAAIVSVTAGAAADGNALVTISRHGTTVAVPYSASYTPTVGHVVMVLVVDGQPTIAFRIIGTP